MIIFKLVACSSV